MKFDVRNKKDQVFIRRIRIYLNDTEVRKCVMADEEAGAIERWETDEQGRVAMFRDENDEHHPRLIQEQGVVRIEHIE